MPVMCFSLFCSTGKKKKTKSMTDSKWNSHEHLFLALVLFGLGIHGGGRGVRAHMGMCDLCFLHTLTEFSLSGLCSLAILFCFIYQTPWGHTHQCILLLTLKPCQHRFHWTQGTTIAGQSAQPSDTASCMESPQIYSTIIYPPQRVPLIKFSIPYYGHQSHSRSYPIILIPTMHPFKFGCFPMAAHRTEGNVFPLVGLWMENAIKNTNGQLSGLMEELSIVEVGEGSKDGKLCAHLYGLGVCCVHIDRHLH